MTDLSFQDMDELTGFGKPASKTADWIVNTYLPNAPVSYRVSIERAIAQAIVESRNFKLPRLVCGCYGDCVGHVETPSTVSRHQPIKAGWVPGKILDELRHACKWAWDADNRNMVILRETIEAIISRYESAAPVDTGEPKSP